MFHDVNSIDDRIKLMKSVSQLRSETRENLLKERMGENTAQEDLEKLFRPITQQLAKEKQVLQNIVNQSSRKLLTPANSTEDESSRTNPDAKIEEKYKKVLAVYGLPLPSEILSNNYDIDDVIKQANNVINGNKLGGMKRGADEETRRELDDKINTRKIYVSTLKYMKRSYPDAKSGKLGDGIKVENKLKVNNGKFGDLTIDPKKLTLGKLEVYKNNKKLIWKKIDKDLFDLLTKKYSKTRQYSNDSIATFNRLLELSGIPKMNIKSPKANLKAIYYSNPTELVQRLEELLSARSAGNTGLEKEINTVLDELLSIGQITLVEYRKILKNNFGYNCKL